jgi:hypothetical protein
VQTRSQKDLMDRKYIDDHHIVARYLADKLPDDEREAFESCYLEDPELLRELEAAARFKVGLMQLRDAGELEGLMQQRSPFTRTLRFAAAAAVIVAAIGIAFLATRNPSPPSMLAASSAAFVDRRGEPLPVAGTYTILHARGSYYDAEIDLPASSATTELRLFPEAETHPPRYRIVLSSISDDGKPQPMGEIGALAPTDDESVRVFLNSRRLGSGTYQLVLSGDTGTSAAGEASTYLIRIRSHDPKQR